MIKKQKPTGDRFLLSDRVHGTHGRITLVIDDLRLAKIHKHERALRRRLVRAPSERRINFQRVRRNDSYETHTRAHRKRSLDLRFRCSFTTFNNFLRELLKF